MTPRMKMLESFKTHPMHYKLFKKLNAAQIEECVQFIKENDHLNRDEFAFKVNRWHLGSNTPMKIRSVQWALVSQTNT